MPDVASTERPSVEGRLDRVGMSGIDVPIRAPGLRRGMVVLAKADAYVDLADPRAKGIHMSRLYRQLTERLPEADLSVPLLRCVLEGFLESHAGISRTAQIRLSFEVPVERGSLVSGLSGWRSYPVEVEAILDEGGLRVWLTLSVVYSSTCPCSAALARQLIRDRFLLDFEGRPDPSTAEVAAWLLRAESICATPHAQRSTATVRLQLDGSVESLDPIAFIDSAEEALQTPVQAHVRRADEQEFTLRSGQNHMFCEDAARRLQRTFEAADGVADFRLEVRHAESLHPHDIVCSASKSGRSEGSATP